MDISVHFTHNQNTFCPGTPEFCSGKFCYGKFWPEQATVIDCNKKMTYIHVLGINFLMNYMSVLWKHSSGINFLQITYHVSVCDSENYMEKSYGNYFLENLISVTQKNVFGINFAIPWSRFCRADLRWFSILAWRILGTLPANFSANFDGEIFQRIFRPCFSRVSGPSQNIHAQNSRPKLSAFLSNFTFWNAKCIHADFLLTGETNRISAWSDEGTVS